jgi:catecholate siderophore receptor
MVFDSQRSSRTARRGRGAAGVCIATAAGLPAMAADATADAGQNNVTPVVVTARKPTITALSEEVQNTAQSIDVLPHQLLQQQAVASLQDALKNVPGVTLNSGEGGAHGDTINLRGFPAADDFFLDGLRDTGFYTRDTFNLDTLEVYKGPASTLFGRGSTGGVVNQVSKTPVLHPIDAGTVSVGTNNDVRGTADVNQMIGADNALRINGMVERSNVTDRDGVLNRHWGIAPSLALGIGGPTSLTLEYLHQEQNDIPDYGIPFVAGKPAPVPRNLDYGLITDDAFKTRVDIATLKFEHDFNSSVSISENARYGHYWFDSRQTGPHYDPSGLVPVPTASTPLSSIMIYRDRPSVDGLVTTEMSETDATFKFATGPLQHTLVAGLDFDRESAALVRYANQISSGLTVGPGLVGPTPLLDPDPYEPVAHQTAVRQTPTTVTDTVAGSLVDSIDLGAHWNFVGAIRLDRFHAHYNQPLGKPSSFDHTDVIPSPRLAVVFKPTEHQSYYVSYGTSFDPSAENLSLAASNANLGPEKDRTFEIGAKAVVLQGMLSLTGALFQTEMTNARVADPDIPSLQALSGDLRVRGLELGAQGHITPQWEILAGYTYLDGITVKSTAPAQVGQPLQNTAHHQANIWTVYDLPMGFKVGTGLNYLGKRPADVDGQAFVPSYLTWDAMLSYQINSNLSLQLNGTNLTNVYYFTNSYYSSPAENHVLPGPGRTFTLTLSAAY